MPTNDLRMTLQNLTLPVVDWKNGIQGRFKFKGRFGQTSIKTAKNSFKTKHLRSWNTHNTGTTNICAFKIPSSKHNWSNSTQKPTSRSNASRNANDGGLWRSRRFYHLQHWQKINFPKTFRIFTWVHRWMHGYQKPTLRQRHQTMDQGLGRHTCFNSNSSDA